MKKNWKFAIDIMKLKEKPSIRSANARSKLTRVENVTSIDTKLKRLWSWMPVIPWSTGVISYHDRQVNRLLARNVLLASESSTSVLQNPYSFRIYLHNCWENRSFNCGSIGPFFLIFCPTRSINGSCLHQFPNVFPSREIGWHQFSLK